VKAREGEKDSENHDVTSPSLPPAKKNSTIEQNRPNTIK